MKVHFFMKDAAGGWRLAVRLMTLALLCIGSRGTWAAASCSGGGTTYTINFPSSISVPRDAAVGTLLTPWVTTTGSVGWSCTYQNVTAGPAAITTIYNQASGVTATYNGTSVTVYRTNVAGVGIAFAHRESMNGNWTQWVGLTSSWYGSWWWWFPGNYRLDWGLQMAAALVKTGPVASAGQIPAGTVAKAGMLLQPPGEAWSVMAPTVNLHNLSAPVNIVPLSCTASDVYVDMHEVPTAGFHGMGSSAGDKSVNFSLNNCPAGMQSISLTVHPINGIVAGTENVAKLSTSSTARGVGVRLQWGSSAPLKLDTKTRVAAYQGQAISLALNLNAAYYQIDPVIQPGTANASFEVSLFYE